MHEQLKQEQAFLAPNLSASLLMGRPAESATCREILRCVVCGRSHLSNSLSAEVSHGLLSRFPSNPLMIRVPSFPHGQL